jgi:hypothetical protein
MAQSQGFRRADGLPLAEASLQPRVVEFKSLTTGSHNSSAWHTNREETPWFRYSETQTLQALWYCVSWRLGEYYKIFAKTCREFTYRPPIGDCVGWL